MFQYILLLTFLTISLVYQSESLLPPSREANKGEAPFMVRILHSKGICGGALIRPDVILTAGHCAVDYVNNLNVHAGTIFVNNYHEGQFRGVRQAVPHENFRVGDNKVQACNDVGLLKLTSPYQLNSDVQAIGLANFTSDLTATLFGFGYENYDLKEDPEVLRIINVTHIPDEECQRILETTKTKSVKEPYEICTQSCACHGDSGSPLIQEFDGIRKVVGVASWLADDSSSCTTPPAVFLKVAEYEDWINAKLMEFNNTVVPDRRPDGLRFNPPYTGSRKPQDNRG